MSLTMGSLFDGIGGFPLAAQRVGIQTLWASEIEAFPIRVTKVRFPEMVHVGDITKLKGAELPPVDVICGGFPCQDLSVAQGVRDGLAWLENLRLTPDIWPERMWRTGAWNNPCKLAARRSEWKIRMK